jgi:hypothetical protein
MTKLKPRKVCDEAIDRMRNGRQKNAARDRRTASIGSAPEGTRR